MNLAPPILLTPAQEAAADRIWALREISRSFPEPLPPIIKWAEDAVRLFGVKGERYLADNTPWTRYPIELCDRIGSVRSITLVKPVQTGGSVVGEIAVCRWICKGFGEIQWNWDTDDFAADRYDKRIYKILRGCRPVRARWPHEGMERFNAKKCLVIFPNVSLTVQGVFTPDALDSDSIPFQVNEEIHKWKPGHLEKAYRRGTACTFPLALNISNASREGDQLWEAFTSGTRQFWEVKCPGCGRYHVMRTRWEDARAELGGLRYDADGCKRDDGTFNYNKLAGTLRYQMPCGHVVPNEINARRALSAAGRYGSPMNDGALPGEISLTYQAVACHDLDWLALVKEKHSALRALRHGDREPWLKYLQERESIFTSEESLPFQGQILLNTERQKSRDGLPDRAARLWAADKQKGYKALGQLSHYWLVIRDVAPNADSLLVFEGQVQTETELIAILDEYQCPRYAGGVDASWDTKTVQEFCYRNGLNAFQAAASHKGRFKHRDGVWRFYSDLQPVHVELNMPPRFSYLPAADGWQPTLEEPAIIAYNLAGLLGNYFFLREHAAAVKANKPDAQPWELIQHEVPADVSEEYKNQCEAWERCAIKQLRTQDEVEGFRKIRKDDHLLMCEAYVAMLIEISGLLGQRLAALGLRPDLNQKQK